jgi:hypothetical protein
MNTPVLFIDVTARLLVLLITNETNDDIREKKIYLMEDFNKYSIR